MTLIECNEVLCKHRDKRGYCKEGYIEIDNNHKCEDFQNKQRGVK